jgi:hypothetical protein
MPPLIRISTTLLSFILSLSLSLTSIHHVHGSTDIDTLQYLSQLEQLGYSYMNQGLNRYNSKALTDAGYPNTTFTTLSILATHDQSHMNSIGDKIVALKGLVKTACSSYEFQWTDVNTFIKNGVALSENTVAAYNVCIQYIPLCSY